MDRFPIYICESRQSIPKSKKYLYFKKFEYIEFIDLIKKAKTHFEFINNASLKCELCGSFINATESIYQTIVKTRRGLSWPENEMMDNLFNKILIPISDTPENLTLFQRGSLKIKPVDPTADPIYECCLGFKYIAEECSFIFDSGCLCKGLLEDKLDNIGAIVPDY
jgi:hypothetical protein